MKKILVAVVLLSMQLITHAINIKSLTGKVIAIKDGDTFVLLTADKRQVTIRMAGIDAPEKNQEFGTKSKNYLAELIAGKNVDVQYTKLDRNGRVLGWVTLNNKSINQMMIGSGMAWHYKKYDNNATLNKLEIKARASGTGLWSQPNAMPPWEKRHSTKPLNKKSQVPV
jgi:micrococcal nuclease